MTEAAVVTAEQSIPPMVPVDLLTVAINKGADLESIKVLMELKERHERNEARKAFFKAMAAFKANPPDIIKDQEVAYNNTRYKHATLGNVTRTINAALGEHGLTAGWKTEQIDGNVSVTCRINHEDGYGEETTLVAPPDKSGSKNNIQAIGSTTSYLQRYTLLAITGLSTSEFDDDGRAYGDTPAAEESQGPDAILVEKFKAGIDFFKTAIHSADDLDKWFDSKRASLELLSESESTEVQAYLTDAFEWLDQNGKFAQKTESKLEVNL